MRVFDPDRWVFATKLFLAGVIAYAVSVRAGLPQSYWAVVTCCVVMNPTTGAIHSKAIYRFCGTLGAGITSLLLASVCANAPLLMIMLAGLVSTLAFAAALLDRTPRAYGWQLFGVTVILVVVAGVDAPANMFDTALARVCEIGVGIACCAFVDSVLAPRSLAPALYMRLQSWLDHMGAWMDHAMSGHGDDAQTLADRSRVIMDITAMSALAGQLAYDPQVSAWKRQCVFAIQGCLLQLVPMLSGLEASCRASSGDPDAQVAGLLRQSRQDLAADIAALWSDVRQIHASLTTGEPLPSALVQRVRQARAFPLPPDAGLVARVCGGILLAYAALCGLWWVTGWSYGANAVLMGVVAIAFFGNLDEAGKAITTFARFTATALVLAAIISYGLLPLAADFPALVVAMALFLLPIGAWAASNPMAILLLGVGLSNTNLQAVYTPAELGVFLDCCLSSLLGVLVAQACIGMMRRMGSAHALQRLAQAGRADLLRLARQGSVGNPEAYANRTLDRIAAMVSRQATSHAADAAATQLAVLRAGVAIASLRHATTSLTGDFRQAVEALMAAISATLDGKGRVDELLPLMNHALRRAGDASRPECREALRSLTWLRLALPAASTVLEPQR
ncbi:FUSC family protein [Cupriavidus numazuensis]|uniref:p-hydroxybenzoic acid efflux pump subunit AaeB n=1 Tax=Cupriavidus numazuensis TaxID=221992 RepID=A0ABN7PZ68_9BURK|nr:FUSC family protein [Cupriavidus numazuensis]CAG2142519.1 p-hydroxybenzoic acid efflux pump subunit AaeB [Cupriavidus numazuensis]